MKLLLDTHILLWALSNDPKLPQNARRLIESEKNTIYYSIISPWEVELKRLAHPNLMPISAQELIQYCEEADFLKISILERHICALSGLERKTDAPPHKDPFDRILVCQASIENMLLITHDRLIAGYTEPCILLV